MHQDELLKPTYVFLSPGDDQVCCPTSFMFALPKAVLQYQKALSQYPYGIRLIRLDSHSVQILKSGIKKTWGKRLSLNKQ